MNSSNNLKIYFYLSRDTKQPVRGTNQSAGIDLFMPNYSKEFENDLREKNPNSNLQIFPIHFYDENGNKKINLGVIIPPHERIIIPSGVYAYMQPKESALIAANKSGVSFKKGLSFITQVIDSDYAGEIYIGLLNTSNESVAIQSGEKLIQVIHTPVYLSSLEQINDKSEFDKLHVGSQRGEGAFGSTDINNN